MELKGYNCYHNIYIQQRISDVDALGHINNGIQQHYYDLARLSYLETLIGVNVEQSDESVVIATINMEFIHPIFFRDSLEAYSKTIRLGNKSMEMVQFLVDTSTELIKSWNKTILVCYDPHTKTSIQIPAMWRQKISEFENDVAF